MNGPSDHTASEHMTTQEVLAYLGCSRGKIQSMEAKRQLIRVGQRNNHGVGAPSTIYVREDVEKIKYALENNIPLQAADLTNVDVLLMEPVRPAGRPPQGEPQRYMGKFSERISKREFYAFLPPWSDGEWDIMSKYMKPGWAYTVSGNRGPGGYVAIAKLAVDMESVLSYALSLQTRTQQGDS